MLEGLQPAARRRCAMPGQARGRGVIATTTPDLVISWICTLKGVPDVPDVPDVPRTSAPSATRLRGRIPLLTKFPGYSSLSLLDPGLQSPIPAGIRNRTFQNRIPKRMPPSKMWTKCKFIVLAGKPEGCLIIIDRRTGIGSHLRSR